MEIEPIVFNPRNPGLGLDFWVALGIACLAGIALWRINRRQRERKTAGSLQPVWSLLFFIVLLIGAGTSAFFCWMNTRTGPVVITSEYLQTPMGRTPWSEVQKIYLHTDQQRSLIDPALKTGEVTKVLVVEGKNGITHLLWEDQYDLAAILEAIEKARGEEVEEGETPR